MFIGATDTTTTDSNTQGSFGDGCTLCLSGRGVVCKIYCYESSDDVHIV